MTDLESPGFPDSSAPTVALLSGDAHPKLARETGLDVADAGERSSHPLDLHEEALESAFPMAVTSLAPDELFLPLLRVWKAEDLVVVAPDAGGTKRSQRFARSLEAGFSVMGEGALERLLAAPLTRLATSDSVDVSEEVEGVLEIVPTAPILARAARYVLGKAV